MAVGFVDSPSVTGIVTNYYGWYFNNIGNAGIVNSFPINIESQSGSSGVMRAINIVGTGVANGIRVGGSANIYASAVNNITISDGTNVGGLSVALTTTSSTINSLTANAATIILQSQTFTAGVTHNAVQVSPTWAAEDFPHRGALFQVSQNGANSQQLIGTRVEMIKNTGATTLATMIGHDVASPIIAGTATTNIGLDVADQSPAGVGTSGFGIRIQSQTGSATISRAMEVVGTGLANGIRLGASPTIYSNGVNNLRMVESTGVGGLFYNLTDTSVTVGTISTGLATITLQSQTFTAGAFHNAIQATPVWVSENFDHVALSLSATQNGTNTQSLRGLNIQMTKMTAATVLGTMSGVNFNSPIVSGTVSDSAVIRINDQTNANITTPRGIVFATAGVANSIIWGGSAIQYASGANLIDFFDSTNARGIRLTLTAAGNQSIDASAGSMDYNDVNVLELTQADLAVGSCALGQLRYDTGGAARELCYCATVNVWSCTTVVAGGPVD